MGVLVCFFQLLERGVGINLRGGYALMTQQLLDVFEPCAVVDHRRGERVAQHVGLMVVTRDTCFRTSY